MQNDGLMKKKRVLEEQLTQLRKTAKLGMLTARELSIAEKRILKQLEEAQLSLRLRDTKKKAVHELLKKEKKTLEKKHSNDDWVSFEQLRHLNVKDLKKKTEQVKVKTDHAKKKEVKEILATLESAKKEPEKNLPIVEDKPVDDKKEQRAALVQEILRESTIPEQMPTFQSQGDVLDPTPGWKMAFVILGLLLVVLLYLKFSSPLTTTPLTATLYSDYTCASCADMYALFTELEDIYGKQLVVKHVMIARDEEGFLAGAAAECAADQGKFLPYHEMLYSTLPELEEPVTEATLLGFAEELQLDVPLFTKCLQSDIKVPLLEKHKREALQQQIDAVPTVILGRSKKLVGLFGKELYMKEINTILGVVKQ